MPEQPLYALDPAPAPIRQLRAGPLTLIYDVGDLRYIRLGEHEIVRRIYVAVRDHNWGTVPLMLSNEQIEATEQTFSISYTATHQQGPVHFYWRAAIHGAADGTISFSMDGSAQTTFLRNRIGFCVLHPAAAAGARCVALHADGTTIGGRLPQLIQPDAPFGDLQGFRHEVSPDIWAELRYTGDRFEMEDQRNWIDASFKTYCTPLSVPYPQMIAAGTAIHQSVTLRIHGAADVHTIQQGANAVLVERVHAAPVPLPSIGLGSASHGQMLSINEIERLRGLNLAHLRCDLVLSDATYLACFRQAQAEASALGIALEVALFLSDAAEAELTAFVCILQEAGPPIARWLIFHQHERVTSVTWLELARQRLASVDPGIPLASGTNMYFTELNRDRPTAELLDLITYSINPQIHAFDHRSLAECCATIADTVVSARAFSAGRPIMISPVTLRPRFNAVATGPERQLAPDELPPQVDLRQLSLFGAAWTLASLKYIAESAVASVTYYETTGWRGVIECAAGSPLPEQFRSVPGQIFPLYHVLADIGAYTEAMPVRSQQPLLVEALLLRRHGHERLLLANMSAEPQTVHVELPAALAYVRLLDHSTVEAALTDPQAFQAQPGIPTTPDNGWLTLELQPYAIARVDS